MKNERTSSYGDIEIPVTINYPYTSIKNRTGYSHRDGANKKYFFVIRTVTELWNMHAFDLTFYKS